ncbi:hypothetical protein CfE428DRAFT_3756 [Chthoniobacter flavus Ellin428]|uniref:Uncharacterized protein n=1 Tax=Chthoniobacter flavus Ellin428 TaxID=497964 RepID=B4D4B8_9BACT|nr:hypothetical protein [Chthoniobacter flavus]EDY18719.1 hypothetical protein CfE428DRAFT_3756 [Chthoniobacter flavus Ellin428]TCO89041.1 hypothetical protein EV701_11575 [Chthoniobacter flavus]
MSTARRMPLNAFRGFGLFASSPRPGRWCSGLRRPLFRRINEYAAIVADAKIVRDAEKFSHAPPRQRQMTSTTNASIDRCDTQFAASGERVVMSENGSRQQVTQGFNLSGERFAFIAAFFELASRPLKLGELPKPGHDIVRLIHCASAVCIRRATESFQRFKMLPLWQLQCFQHRGAIAKEWEKAQILRSRSRYVQPIS